MESPHDGTIDLIHRLTRAVAESPFNSTYESEKDIYPFLGGLVKAAVGPESNGRWTGDKLPPPGVPAFGRTCRPDGVVSCASGEQIAIEAKLLLPGSTDGIFHSLIQGIVYSRQFAAALVIILDRSGRPLIGNLETELFEELREHFRVWVAYRPIGPAAT